MIDIQQYSFSPINLKFSILNFWPKRLNCAINLILGLLYKTGAIDEALILMKDAISIDEKDPDSNFFIANLYSAKVTEQSMINHATSQ